MLADDPDRLDQYRDEMTDEQYWELKYRIPEMKELIFSLHEQHEQEMQLVRETAAWDQRIAEPEYELRQHSEEGGSDAE